MEYLDENPIAGLIVFLLVVAVVIVIAINVFKLADESSKKYHREQVQQIDECIKKTNDFDWCMDKFYK